MVAPPWWLAWVGYGLQGVVAILAHAHARKAPFHRPLAHYATWVAVVDFCRYPLEATRPHQRALFTLDELSFLSLPVALCLTVIRVSERSGATGHRPRRIFICSTILTALAIALGYPYSAACWVYVVVQFAAVGSAWFLLGRAFWRGKCWMGVTEMTVASYLATETVVLLGNYFFDWSGVWSLMLGLNVVVLALHAGWEATTRTKSRREYD